jgi:DNA-binding transcriptional LysR family regulator
LFDRAAGGPATLTREGERAYRRVSSILADLSDLSWDVGGGRSGTRGRLRIAIHPYIMRYASDAIAEFKGLHPEVNVTVDFELAMPTLLNQRVQDREIEVAYFFTFDAEGVPPSELVRLEPLAIYVARSHPLASKSVVTAADIRTTPAVGLAARNPLRIAVDRALEQAGCGGGPRALEADEYGLILTSAQRGDGFVCMFEALAKDAAQSADLVPVSLEHPVPALQIRQIARHSVRHDPLANGLVEIIGRALKTS